MARPKPLLLIALTTLAAGLACSGGDPTAGPSTDTPHTGESDSTSENGSASQTGEDDTPEGDSSETLGETSDADPSGDTSDGGETSDGDPSDPSRVLLIIADDFGVDAMLAYADEDQDGVADDGRIYAPSPTISAICHEGVAFMQTWAQPLCSPTRATMLTGRYAFRTGVGSIAKGDTNNIGTEETTVPRVLESLADLDIAHANIGKWHLGVSAGLGGPMAPNQMGWSHYAGLLSGALMNYWSWSKTTNGETTPVDAYATTEMVDDAETWLEGVGTEQPWLLWLALVAPHEPFHLPPAELHSAADLSGSAEDIEADPAPYYRAMVEAMDTEIARLLDWLDTNGHDNVHLIFLGDNGTPRQAMLPPYPPSRAKGTLYQGGIRVPLCIRSPRVAEPGSRVDAMVHTVDLFPTLLELTGADPGSDLPDDVLTDGRSLTPFLDDASVESQHDVLVSELFNHQTDNGVGKTIRDQRYKLIRFDDGTDVLFDLEQDPLEQDDLLSGQPGDEILEIRDRLVGALENLLATED